MLLNRRVTRQYDSFLLCSMTQGFQISFTGTYYKNTIASAYFFTTKSKISLSLRVLLGLNPMCSVCVCLCDGWQSVFLENIGAFSSQSLKNCRLSILVAVLYSLLSPFFRSMFICNYSQSCFVKKFSLLHENVSQILKTGDWRINFKSAYFSKKCQSFLLWSL